MIAMIGHLQAADDSFQRTQEYYSVVQRLTRAAECAWHAELMRTEYRRNKDTVAATSPVVVV